MTEGALLLLHVAHGIHLPEAVQVELADEAGEVGGLEGAGVGGGSGRQDLALQELLVDDDYLAAAVPADGFISRVVHQTPEFRWKIIGVDGIREGTMFVHVCSLYSLEDKKTRVTMRLK